MISLQPDSTNGMPDGTTALTAQCRILSEYSPSQSWCKMTEPKHCQP